MANWAVLAILGAASFGIVSIIDSHLLTRKMPGIRAYFLLVSPFQLVYSLVFLFLFPLPAGTDIGIIVIAVISVVIRVSALIIMMYTLLKEEVSQVVPIVYTYPVFVAIMAMPLLGETLDSLQWLAIIVVVIGAVAVSFRLSSTGSLSWRGRSLLLLLGASLLLALADITAKHVMNYIQPWNMFWINGLCISGMFILISLRRQVLQQIGGIKQVRTTMFLLALNVGVLGPVTMLMVLLALQAGPVSLVSTVMGGSRPVFVFIYAFILSRVFPGFIRWHADGRMLILRLVAIAMIAGGVAVIQLG
ncbi:EamA family transporter [Chloroflexota bacterium]